IPKVTPVVDNEQTESGSFTGSGVGGSTTEEDFALPPSPTDCISTITGQSIPCTSTETQQNNNRPLGNFESYGYTKTKVDTFTDKYEKDDDVVCLNTFSGLEVDCP
ncbi:hypothetical protein KKG48_01585, partial [Patescibacteria group bacterium]|nr:hypothetical protein [Patescibacteria group bacterium]